MNRMKRILAVSLALLFVFAVCWSAFAVGTAAESGCSVGKARISDDSKRAYVNKMLAYHLSEKGEPMIAEALKSGKNVLFFFEGASNHAIEGDNFYDVKRYRFGAVCIVVKQVENVPTIVFFDDYSSTLPDNPRAAESRADAVATLLDGVYPIVNCNHFGFAALHVPAYDWGTAVRCFKTGHYIDVCYGINIHSRGSDNITPTSNNSSGCLLVGKAPYWSESYNQFMYAVTGIENARFNAFDEVALNYGCVVIDRALYKKELKQIYDTGAGDQNEVVRKLTAYTDGLRVPDPVPEESDVESIEESKVESSAESAEESKAESAAEGVEESVEESVTESSATEEKESESKLFVILLAVAGVVLVGVAALVVVMKKKKPAAANGASAEDKEQKEEK